jgi:uncharacterized protein
MTLPSIDVRDLVGHLGANRVEHVHGTMQDLGTEMARVRDDDQIEAELQLESLVEGILVSGTVTGTMAMRCARCLTEFERSFELSVGEMFLARPVEDEPAGDVYLIDPGGVIDPDQMVRDAVGVELPFSPLCRPGCKGLCPVCGGDRNRGECPGDHPTMDPRWADLERLLDQMDHT